MKKEKSQKIKNAERVSLWIKLPPDLRNLFKAYCAKRGKTMTQLIVKFMKNTLSGKKM